MHLVIKGFDKDSRDAVREFAKRRVTSKLSRISKRIRSIEISVRDVNGPRGGKDHAIQCLVRLRPSGQIVIQHQDFGPYSGIALAIKRAIVAVKRALGRRRSNRIDSYRRNLLLPAVRSNRRRVELERASINALSAPAAKRLGLRGDRNLDRSKGAVDWNILPHDSEENPDAGF